MAAAVEDSVLLNIGEMIDLAIGTPEIGVVDFCMLQTVLHCLAQQLGVLNKNVELKGNIAVLPVGRPADDAITLAVEEFVVETDGKDAVSPEEQDTLLVVERVRKGVGPLPARAKKPDGAMGPDRGGKSKVKAAKSTGKVAKSAKSTTEQTGSDETDTDAQPPSSAPGEEDETQKGGEEASGAEAPAVEAPAAVSASSSKTSATRGAPRGLTSTEKLSLVTLSKFNLLETTVEDLKNRVYGSIPKNEEILEEVRSQSNLKSITDMWTSLNVSSRLEAAEEGIQKLSSLIEDVIKDCAEMAKKRPSKTAEPPPAAAPVPVPVAAAEPSPDGAAPAVNIDHLATKAELKQVADTVATRDGLSQAVNLLASKEDLMGIVEHIQNLREDHDKLASAFYEAMKEMNQKFATPPPARQSITMPLPSFTAPPPPPPEPSKPAPIAQSPAAVEGPGTGASVAALAALEQSQASLSTKLNDLEKKLKQCVNVVFTSDGSIRDQMSSLQDQLDHYVSQLPPGGVDEDEALMGQGGKIPPNIAKELQSLMQLFQTVQTMQEQLKNVHETAMQLASEKDERQQNINSLLEQIELLKMIKLDREDMVEALADKADMRLLARKVSHDKFEMACDDLSKGLEQALGKLNVQESIWQQALDDIQREIETKLDKMELAPVKDFFNNKLKQLQENLKKMAELRKEAQAAGTKQRLLQNVNCISCDAKAVMNMDPPAPASIKPLPAHMSMKPYLSYELDAIRKTQQTNIPQRNMHDWEKIDKQMTGPKPPQKVRSDTDKHLCNRYCGGSHTTTSAAQRVARLGHFIKQWGPEVLPLSSAYATGDDGRLYKVSATEPANVGPGGAVDATCTAKPPPKKAEDPRQKGYSLKPECRCLEVASADQYHMNAQRCSAREVQYKILSIFRLRYLSMGLCSLK